MSKEEDLARLRAENSKEQLDAYNMLWHLVSGPPEGIKHCGYKDLGDACEKIVRRAQGACEKRLRAFERKYPS